MSLRVLAIAAPLLASLATTPVIAQSDKIDSNCSYKGISLHGKVQVVKAFADIKVQVVRSFPDLKVQEVTAFPDRCGQWQFVTSFPDFTIEYVNAFPDLTIEFVTSFPGASASASSTPQASTRRSE